jgi:Predicted metal-dependent enzyme
MKSSNVGGQAVIEGIMMRHADNYAIAVRKPDKEIALKKEPCKSIIKNKKVRNAPIIRGVLSFFESLIVGTQCLMYSSSFYEEEEGTKPRTKDEQAKQERRDTVIMYITMVVSLLISVALFFMLPYYAASFLRKVTSAEWVIAIAEALIRIALFVAYILLISKMKDIQRVFMYHGAEHKCINCVEHGMELNVDNVMKSSREHKRCGTSFLLFVMVISVILFLFIRVPSPWLRVVVRLLMLPLIAGISYEIIKWAGRSESAFVNLLSKPGLALQKLTTKEPTRDMVEVAIVAVEAVFDWRKYLEENFANQDGEAK